MLICAKGAKKNTKVTISFLTIGRVNFGWLCIVKIGTAWVDTRGLEITWGYILKGLEVNANLVWLLFPQFRTFLLSQIMFCMEFTRCTDYDMLYMLLHLKWNYNYVHLLTWRSWVSFDTNFPFVFWKLTCICSTSQFHFVSSFFLSFFFEKI